MSVFHILVVDNDPWTVKMVSSLLSRRGHRVVVAHSASEAESQLALCWPDGERFPLRKEEEGASLAFVILDIQLLLRIIRLQAKGRHRANRATVDIDQLDFPHTGGCDIGEFYF